MGVVSVIPIVFLVMALQVDASPRTEALCGGGVACGSLQIIQQPIAQPVVYQQQPQQPVVIYQQAPQAPAPYPISFDGKVVDSDKAARKSFRSARSVERRSRRVERSIKRAERRYKDRVQDLNEYMTNAIKREKREYVKRFWELKEGLIKKIDAARVAVGPPGPIGKRGPRGPQGIQGSTGRPGPRGPRGFVGAQGPRGKPGRDGKRGKQGPPGLRGPPGLPGKQGIAGDAGKRGPTGPVGQRGERGKQGYAGDSNEAKCDRIGGEFINGYCFKSTTLDGDADKVPENCNVQNAPSLGWGKDQYTPLCKAFRSEDSIPCDTFGDSADAGNCATDKQVFLAFEQSSKPNVFVHAKTFDWNPTAGDKQGECHLKQGMVALYVCKV